MSLYFLLLLITISFPLLRSFEHRVKYYSKWPPLGLAMMCTGIIFISWDVIFTKMGVWGFNDRYLSGIYLIQLPIEEWLFFVCAPFASIFIYENVIYFIKRPFNNFLAHKTFFLVGVFLIALSFIFFEKAYTFYNFLGCGILLILHAKVFKATYASHFIIGYLIHLVPFLMVNGILTGSFLDEPIVFYNNADILGIRIGTVPVEDSIYALFLLLLNVSFYEYFKKLRVFQEH